MRLLPILAMPLLALFAGPLIVLAPQPRPAGGPAPLLVVSTWGAEAEARIAAAGGRPVGPFRAPFGLLAASDDPGFARALREAGALAVIDGRRLAALCGGDA